MRDFVLPVFLLLASLPLSGRALVVPASEHGVRGDAGDGLQTVAIQRALDAAGRLAAERGEPAVVQLPQGRIHSGALFFRADNVSLEIPEGCTLAGSADWRDYGDGAWTDAFLSAHGRRNIGLVGAGTLDCGGPENPNGEEKYRGPHALRLSDCSGVLLRDVTIRNAGNYAVCCWNGTDIALDGVTVLGGHDGLHAQNCRDLRLARCDFRTGDDCVAGADNLDVVVERCRFNSSCNAFRFGVENFTVRGCVFQGPGEYPHLLSLRNGGAPRHNMRSAFTHFSPPDRNPKRHSDNWLVEDCILDRVHSLYTYNYVAGTWQNGLPAKRLVFRRVTATNLAAPLEVVGDAARSFDLTLDDVTLALAPETAGRPVVDLFCLHAFRAGGLRLRNDGTAPLLRVRVSDLVEWTDGVSPEGNRMELDDIRQVMRLE